MATNLDHPMVQDACDELIQLESTFDKVTIKNLEIKELHNVSKNMKKNSEYVQFCECLEDSAIPRILLRVMHLLGLENHLASMTMLPSLVDEFRRQCQSPFRPAKLNNGSSETTTAKVRNDQQPITTPETVISATSGKRTNQSDHPDATSEDGFEYPKKFARTESHVPPVTTTSNSFETLMQMNTSAPTNTQKAPPPPEETTSTDRPQPIFLKTVPTYKNILKRIQELLPEKFEKKAIDDLIRITLSSIDHFRIIQRETKCDSTP